tara:strand:+ start:29 stop:451 length:423 start_codon:yes stop_codon:yes gene_type:complete
MKITKSQLKQIIKEELIESNNLVKEFGGVATALGAIAGRPNPSVETEDTPDSEIQLRAEDFFTNLVITDKVVQVLVNNIAISDLRTIMQKIPKIDTAEQEEIVAEENNPWAICTASVGREDKEKYEKCVKSVKKQNGGKQ